MSIRARVLGAVLAVGALLVVAGGAAGHALLLASDPAAGTSVAAAPAFVTLTFGETPDAQLSRVRVLDTAGQDHASGPVEAVPAKAAQLRVPVGPLADGVYTVAWRAVSAVDGHASAGSYAFGVGAGTVVSAPSPVEATGTTAGSGLAAIARWPLYGGLAGVLGAGLVGALLHPRPPRRLRGVAAAGWLLAAAGTVGVVAFQWLDSGAALTAFLGSSLGLIVVARVATILATGVVVAALWRREGDASARRPLFAVVLATAATALVVDVLGGHAAASATPALAVAMQSVHGLAAGLWMGGLAALLVAVIGLPTDEKALAVRRYSTAAGVLIGLVALSGIARAIDQVGTLAALVSTDFGRIVVLKSGALMALAGLGALNRFINVPAAVRSLAGLRRAGSVEVTVGAIVFLLTALLVNAVPPISAGPAAPAAVPLVATGSDFGTTVRVRLTVTPGTPGFNDFSASVADYDTASPPPAGATVSLRFTLASRAGVGSSRLDLPAVSAGTFEASGANLSIDGIWDVTAVVGGSAGAVEVPFVLATRVPPQPDVADASVKPVIHTVSLPTGGTVQIYLDPGNVGPNDLHVTFFDAAGNELPVPSVTMAVSRPDTPGELLSPRLLEPGHFVASLTLPASGSLSVDAVGPAPDGNPIHAYLEVEVAP
jgi:copper transport protein